ncbi:MAG: hypothetical protein ACLGGV_07160 [Bacteroidia bacterium]
MLENLLISSPSLAIFSIDNNFPLIITTLFFCFLFLIKIPSLKIRIATPFIKFAFEFIIGFRKTYFFILLIYLIFTVSILNNNYYVGIFSVIMLFECIVLYQISYLEPKYFLLNFYYTPAEFLLFKIKTSIYQSIILIIIPAIFLSIIFPNTIAPTLIVVTIGFFVVILSVIMRYSFYPDKMNSSVIAVIMISEWIPPSLVYLIPIMYSRAKINLKNILTQC